MKGLYVLVDGNKINDWGVRFWMQHRVMPRNRHNVDELLYDMGLSEYDVFEIFKYNNGATATDCTWVHFEEGLTFRKLNPDYADEILADVHGRYNEHFGIKGV